VYKIGSTAYLRAKEMAAVFSTGVTFRQLSKQYGLSGSRSQQILRKIGITGKDGGWYVRRQLRQEEKKKKREITALIKYGCSFSQLQSAREFGNAPFNAFRRQRSNARQRRIPWKITFWDWWQVWQRSGKWPFRGRSVGCYVMSRFGDSGPYAVTNVEIILASENCSRGRFKRWPESEASQEPL
jgi:hypothetical protein